ncbi:MAG TPA: hypothetical protein HA354_05910, partial [Candidatus Poseidoniaceae archaeon]
MNSENVWVESFVVGALAMRCSIVTDLRTGDTIIIDGGAETDRIISWIENFSGPGPDWSNGPTSQEE